MKKNNETLSKSLIAALACCDLKALPERDTKEFYWLKAIGLVSKSDGTKSYVLLRMGSDLNPVVIRDFGSVSAIVAIEEAYPFVMLGERWIPVFKTTKKEERLEWLRSMGDDTDRSGSTLKEIDKAVIGKAVEMAWNELKLTM